MAEMRWLLLMYTASGWGSREHMAVLRMMRQVGSVQLVRGVWTLPEQRETLIAFATLAAKIERLGGQVLLVEQARLPQPWAERVVARAREQRASEYREIQTRAETFIAQVHCHGEYSQEELPQLKRDQQKLLRLLEQVERRDHFPVTETITGVIAALLRLEQTLGSLTKPARYASAS